jgi:hypothetical protein
LPAFIGGRFRSNARYFFIIEYDEREIDDPDGVVLPNGAAAIEYGRRIIDDLRKDHRPEDPEATIVVKTTAGEVIYRFPGN